MDSFLWAFSGSEIGGEFDRECVSGYSDPNLAETFLPKDTSLGYDILDLHLSSEVPDPVIHSMDMAKRLDYAKENDYSDSILTYINQVLMEDDFEDEDSAVEDSTLHAAEQSFYETLSKNIDNSSPNRRLPREDTSSSSDDNIIHSCHTYTSCISADASVESGILSGLHGHNVSHTHCPHVENALLTNSQSFCLPNYSSHTAPGVEFFLVKAPPESQSDRRSNGGIEGKIKAKPEKDGGDLPVCLLRGRKNVQRERSDCLEEQISKRHLAVGNHEEIVLSEMFDKVLSLCEKNEDSALGTHDGALPNGEYSKRNELAKVWNGEITCNKKGVSKRKAIDMRSLLIQCMESVAGNDHSTASKLLSHIRLLCSPQGDGSQRSTHYFANSLEARLFGFEKPKFRVFASEMSDADLLKTHKLYHSQSPHIETYYFFSTQVIMKVAEKANCLHIIDFGIKYGLQWSSLIQRLSTRPGGPPKLRITGIELPQSGFQPAARVKETGRRLANYCKRFNIPFEYNGLAQQWETVSIEDLRIGKDEVVVVNCLYQLMLLHDDTILEHSPRDAVLNLIKRINPETFIHGVVNGPFNSPFFVSRFREALFYYSTLFDMFEAYFPRDNEERNVFERDVLGHQIMNVIACEGLDRVVRPETYKQWQIRTQRAGFRQLPLNQEIMTELRAKFESCYHKGFFVDEASHWMLVGWKGRAMVSFSCWRPT